MLTIRESQLKVLAKESFERWLVQHVLRHFPQQAQSLDSDLLRTSVREKWARATRYFSSESGICTFIDLTFLLGDEFDNDPQLPWAREILTKTAISDADRRRRLYEKTREHLIRRSRAAKTGRKHV